MLSRDRSTSTVGDHRLLARSLPLAWLAPDSKGAIRGGTQPVELPPSALRAFDPLPLAGADQRSRRGFPAPA